MEGLALFPVHPHSRGKNLGRTGILPVYFGSPPRSWGQYVVNSGYTVLIHGRIGGECYRLLMAGLARVVAPDCQYGING
jgi:hypothetical protein